MLSSPILPPEMIRTKWEKALNRFFICTPSNPLLVSEECEEQKTIKRAQTDFNITFYHSGTCIGACRSDSNSHMLRAFPNTFTHVYLNSLLCCTTCMHLNRDFLEILTTLSSGSTDETPMGTSEEESRGTECLLSVPESISRWKAKHHQMAGKSHGQGAPIMLNKTQERYREDTISSMHSSMHSNNVLSARKQRVFHLNHLVDDKANMKANSLST